MQDHPSGQDQPQPSDREAGVPAASPSAPISPAPTGRQGQSGLPPSALPNGRALLSWLAIVMLVGYMIWLANVPQASESEADRQGVSGQDEMIGKVIVGASQWLSGQWDDMLLDQARVLKKHTAIRKQVCYVVLSAELKGPDAALTQVREIAAAAGHGGNEAPATQATRSSEADLQLIGILNRLYQARSEQREFELDADERTILETEMGWFGRLAPLTNGTPEVEARQRFLVPLQSMPVVLVGLSGWYLACGLAGAVVLLILLILALQGQLQHGFGEASGCGAVYVETFAIWLVLFQGLRLAALQVPTPRSRMAISATIIVVSLAAIFWPRVRGIPWATVRRDIGLVLPARPWKELLFGPATYCMSLPIMLLGIVIMLGLMLLKQGLSPEAPLPSHPAQEVLVGADLWTIIQVMVLGVIVAPVTEEIMFRGVLYRHLRDASSRFGLVISVAFSAVVSSLIFAAIHPQGWVFIPVLMGLAVGFCLAREWRGSLLPSMIAHGITNFITLLISVLLFSNG